VIIAATAFREDSEDRRPCESSGYQNVGDRTPERRLFHEISWKSTSEDKRQRVSPPSAGAITGATLGPLCRTISENSSTHDPLLTFPRYLDAVRRIYFDAADSQLQTQPRSLHPAPALGPIQPSPLQLPVSLNPFPGHRPTDRVLLSGSDSDSRSQPRAGNGFRSPIQPHSDLIDIRQRPLAAATDIFTSGLPYPSPVSPWEALRNSGYSYHGGFPLPASILSTVHDAYRNCGQPEIKPEVEFRPLSALPPPTLSPWSQFLQPSPLSLIGAFYGCPLLPPVQLLPVSVRDDDGRPEIPNVSTPRDSRASSNSTSPSLTAGAFVSPNHAGWKSSPAPEVGTEPSALDLCKRKSDVSRQGTRGYRSLPYPLRRKDGRIQYECISCGKAFGQLSNLKVLFHMYNSMLYKICTIHCVSALVNI